MDDGEEGADVNDQELFAEHPGEEESAYGGDGKQDVSADGGGGLGGRTDGLGLVQ